MIMSVAGIWMRRIIGTLLLDIYPTAAGAYSLRKLRTDYTGYCVRVRRSSDNAEMNVGFSGDLVDMSAILSWAGSDSVYVTIWYDQSGNGINMPQTTNSSQPRLVNAGTPDTENSNYTMVFDGTDDHFNGGDVLDPAGTFNIFIVVKDTKNTFNAIYAKSDPDGGVSNKIAIFITTSVMYWRLVDNTGEDITESPADNNQNLLEQWYLPGTTDAHKAYRNDTLINSLTWSGSTLAATTFDFLIGAHSDSGGTGIYPGSYMAGNFQEFIMYHADKSGDRSNITTNINDFYAIF